jgi:hypothetical protein
MSRSLEVRNKERQAKLQAWVDKAKNSGTKLPPRHFSKLLSQIHIATDWEHDNAISALNLAFEEHYCHSFILKDWKVVEYNPIAELIPKGLVIFNTLEKSHCPPGYSYCIPFEGKDE